MTCYCGGPAEPGRTKCGRCLAKNRAYAARRKARGLCPSCPAVTGDGRTCGRCKARRLANDRAKRAVGLR